MPQRTVLIVDPDTAFADRLRHLLEPYDLTCVTVDSGNDALARARDLNPSLLVICVELSGKPSGYELLSTAKRSATTRNVPIILTSNPADAKAEQVFREHNRLKNRANEYLFKNAFDDRDFLMKVDAILGIGPLQPHATMDEIDIPVETDVEMLEEIPMVSGVNVIPVIEESEERTFAGSGQQIDLGIDAEADAAFAAIGADAPAQATEGSAEFEDAAHTMSGPGQGPGFLPAPLPDPEPEMEAMSEAPAEAPAEEAELMAEPAHEPEVQVDSPTTLQDLRAQDMPDLLGLEEVGTAVSSAFEAPATPAMSQAATRGAPPATPRMATQPPPAASAPDPAVLRELEELRLKSAEWTRERERLERELADNKARADKAAAGSPVSKEREFLNLRETITRKDKDIRELKDEIGKKDRAILDIKEEVRTLEGTNGEQDVKILGLEREVVESHEKIDALAHDKERAVEREKQIKARLGETQLELKKTYDEVDLWKGKHAKLDETAKADLATARAETAAAVRAAHQQREAALEAAHEQAAAERAALEAAHKQAGEDAARAASDALRGERDRSAGEAVRLRRESQEALAAAEKKRQDELAAAEARRVAELDSAQQQLDAALAAAHQQRVTELEAAAEAAAAERAALVDQHEGATTRLREEAESALAEAEQRRVGELAAAEQRRMGELAAAEQRRVGELAVADKRRQDELATLDRLRQDELAQQAREANQAEEAANAEHAAAQAEAAERHRGEVERLRAEHARASAEAAQQYEDQKAGIETRWTAASEEARAAHLAEVATLQGEVAGRDRDLAANRERIQTLASDLEVARGRIVELERQVAALHDGVAGRDGQINDLTTELQTVKDQNAGYREQVVNAYSKIKNDEQLADKARKAMAVALTLLDEQLRTSNGAGSREDNS